MYIYMLYISHFISTTFHLASEKSPESIQNLHQLCACFAAGSAKLRKLRNDRNDRAEAAAVATLAARLPDLRAAVKFDGFSGALNGY